jgi:MoaA/NifB/PqqE/SkfB family radical SAM enzyme
MTIRVNQWPGQPTKVAIFTGITCNLACTLCGPTASSLWRSELGLGKYSDNEYTLEQDEIVTEVADYDFSKLEHVTFSGGEPLLNKSSLEIFRALDSSVDILFHSNGTTLPSQEYLDQFARFNNFVLVFSIDDIEEQFELLRWPAKWNKVVENIAWMRDNCPLNVKFAFNTVVSQLNEATYHRVQEWVQQNIPANRAGNNTDCFTNETNGLLNRVTKTDDRDPIEFLDNLDARRGTNWRRVFPLCQL